MLKLQLETEHLLLSSLKNRLVTQRIRDVGQWRRLLRVKEINDKKSGKFDLFSLHMPVLFIYIDISIKFLKIKN